MLRLLANNKWIMSLTASLVCLSAVAVQAAPYNAGGITVDADPSWVTGQILTDAMAMTRVLKRPILTYHWVPRHLVQINGRQFPAAGPVANQDQGLRQLIAANMASRMARFWDLNLPISGRAETGGAMAPNGLYVAMEPVISQSYGGNDWLMYQVQFPEGTRYMDGRYDHPVVGSALGQALSARGCTVHTTRDLIKSDTTQVACRKALNDLVAATKSALIAYIFRAEPFKADCNGWGWSTAFVVTRPDAISQLNFLVRDLPPQDDGLIPLRQLLNGVFQRVGRPAVFTSLPTANEAETKNFITSNYFTCNREVLEW